ncbi:calpastatin [Ochotona princeps]|uniref:calpastatin n=1 Tax=Ochotona princeps TaxID=9978 RepID=UPI002714C325|nr:calpastatin [Ochotona princeps]
MSQPGQKPAASPRPRRARHTQEHVNEKASGSSSKPGEKKGSDEGRTQDLYVQRGRLSFGLEPERLTSYFKRKKRGFYSLEKKAASLGSSEPSRTHADGAAAVTKVSASPGAASKPASMNPTGAKVEGPHSPDKKRHRRQTAKTEKSQPTQTTDGPEKKPREAKPKEQPEPKSSSRHTSEQGSKDGSKEKEPSAPEKAAEPKTKARDTISAGEKNVAAGITATPGKPDDQKKQKKPLAAAAPAEPKPDKPSGKSDMDAALDDLIDTLGDPGETNEDTTPYTGPEISDPMISTYLEELGKREGTIPPEYRELLAKKTGITVPPPDSSESMGPDDAINALSSDFTCPSPAAGAKEAKKEKSEGEVLKAESAKVIKSAAPPQEKKRKVEEDAMSDQALEALSASLGTRIPEPELDLSSIKEVAESKAKEEKVEKCGEDDETVPAEYRLKPTTDKDGKPLLPEPEEKPKVRSESELIDELSEGFSRTKWKDKQSKPAENTEDSKAAASAPVTEAVGRTSMCSVQSAPAKPASQKGRVPDDAVDTLASSLGRKEADPEDGKPVADQTKEKAKEKDREKLGEKEETIPPDYRLEEVKDKDGKPLPPAEPKAEFPAMTEDDLLDALSEDFGSLSKASPLKFDDAKLAAAVSEVVSHTPAPVTHAAAPPPHAQPSDKELDDALDKLSDSLGQRQPDPDENKPMEDKVKERAKKEHRDKLGERDDTIPPEYRHLLDQGDKDKPEKPTTKKSKEMKKPAGEQDPIDALSSDLDSCPSATETSQDAKKEKSKKTVSSSKAGKHADKAKDSTKTTEETSKPKKNEKTTS